MLFTIRSPIISGLRHASAQGFPTINVDPAMIPAKMQQGVFAAVLRYDTRTVRGVFYFGPRSDQPDSVVAEIHCFESLNIKGSADVEITLIKQLRPVKKFKNKDDLTCQIQEDIRQAGKVLQDY